jgi:c-di-GMP-related signal transduction protein
VKHYLKLVRSFHSAKVGVVDLISLAYVEIGQEQLRSLLEDLADSWIMMIVEKIGIEFQLVKLHNHIIRHGQGYLFGEPRESKH